MTFPGSSWNCSPPFSSCKSFCYRRSAPPKKRKLPLQTIEGDWIELNMFLQNALNCLYMSSVLPLNCPSPLPFAYQWRNTQWLHNTMLRNSPASEYFCSIPSWSEYLNIWWYICTGLMTKIHMSLFQSEVSNYNLIQCRLLLFKRILHVLFFWRNKSKHSWHSPSALRY